MYYCNSSYCNSNPVMMIDDKGNMPKWAKWLIGGAVIAALAVATVVTSGTAGVIMGLLFTDQLLVQ